MIRRDLKKAICSKYYIATIIALVIAIIGDTIIRYGQSNIKDRFSISDVKYIFSEYRDPYVICHDAGGYIMGFYVFAFIAAFAIIKLCGDECEQRYMNITIPRVGYFKYIKSKFIAVYLSGMIAIIVAFFLSFLMAHILFDMPLDFDVAMENMSNHGLKGTNMYALMAKGYGYVAIFILLLKKAVYVGMWSVVTLMITVYLKDRSIAVFVTASVIIVYDCAMQLLPKTITKCMGEKSIFMGNGVENLPYEGVPLHISIMIFISTIIFLGYAYGVHRRMKNG